MKKIIYLFLVTVLSTPISFARDPGTGSNTTPDGSIGPATPDAASDSTSIMGGGTPGNDGEDTFNLKDPTDKDLRQIKQHQEERQLERQKAKDAENSN